MAEGKGIAQEILTQLGSQVDLGTTLATALIGGMVALLTQVALHNAQHKEKSLRLDQRWMVLFVFGAELVSLIAGYLARGTITGVTPILLQLPEAGWLVGGNPVGFTDVEFKHSGTLRVTMLVQMLSLFIGLVFICCFAYANRKHVK